ncbi:DNA-binding response regulator [Sphingobium sp. SCG-1]|uniref:response regulator n=1 Tax=Sphingobium sp. SCG-1 TaxID=2072936 RepID=UPI000CD67F01|nr:response regulator transcription factor [Sphingobium sp. SCG-1]AUW58726.1 DNA-binding response regulator [Sphingobium sp. SCG-1]
MNTNVLIVEDDPALRTLLTRSLQQNGFSANPTGSAAEAWAALEEGGVDIIVLDVMLPGTNGLDMCREIRRERDVPIIFLSAKGTEVDRIVGLEVGADDYLAKPFDTRELIARIRAVLRRGGMDRRQDAAGYREAHFDGWTVHFPRRQLLSPANAVVELTGAEFDLLTAFLENPQRVIAREKLIELSKARLGDASERSIDVLISRLRRKITHGNMRAPIVTVRGTGYMFSTEVTRE